MGPSAPNCHGGRITDMVLNMSGLLGTMVMIMMGRLNWIQMLPMFPLCTSHRTHTYLSQIPAHKYT